MQKPKKRNLHSPGKSRDWLAYLNDSLPTLVIPVGPRFQADVPEWTGSSKAGSNHRVDGNPDDSRWLGTRIWPTSTRANTNVGRSSRIGKGRPDFCSCTSPGSSECVKLHIAEERTRLKIELGPAFKSWRFDQMGEEVAYSWSDNQQKKFVFFVRMNPVSQDRNFLKPALTCFKSKTQEEIVSYYLNVYLPRRISESIRSGCTVFDSDDDDNEEALNAKPSKKRSPSLANDSAKHVKPRYLTGRR